MDQPIQALEHLKFREMITVASRATNGVKIPGRKLTRAEIQKMFKAHMTDLKSHLNVCLLRSCVIFLIVSRVQTLSAK